jgi:hypothetical protein
MTDSRISSTRRRLAPLRAAAVAGILFVLLYSVSVTLIRLGIPKEATKDNGLGLETNAHVISLALNLMPYAGITFCGSSALLGTGQATRRTASLPRSGSAAV